MTATKKPEILFKGIEDYASDEYIAPFTIAIGGLPGSGKTTLALSMAERMPVYFLETEDRFGYIAKKLHKQLPGAERIFAARVGNWADILAALSIIKSVTKDNDPKNRGCIVLDSGTDFKNYADAEWRRTSKVHPPVNWSKMYKMMNEVVKGIKRIGLSVIFTNRVKPEYDSQGNVTGNLRFDAYKNQIDLTEVAIMIGKDYSLEIIKNSWHDALHYGADSQSINRDMTLPAIIDILQK